MAHGLPCSPSVPGLLQAASHNCIGLQPFSARLLQCIFGTSPACPVRQEGPFLCAGNFPKSVCTSVNECMCHGIPDTRILQDGDIVNVDVTVYYKVRRCCLSLVAPKSADAAAHIVWQGLKCTAEMQPELTDKPSRSEPKAYSWLGNGHHRASCSVDCPTPLCIWACCLPAHTLLPPPCRAIMVTPRACTMLARSLTRQSSSVKQQSTL